jgi:hypothetical protein
MHGMGWGSCGAIGLLLKKGGRWKLEYMQIEGVDIEILVLRFCISG